jgi:hypothetical protein
MKKILISFFALAFLLGAVSVMAKADKSNKDFSKPLKVSDFKIEKRQILSKEDRLKADEAMKGGKLGSAKGKTSPTISGATGILGDHSVDNSKKYAIVIGLSNYAGTINDLCVAKTDQATGTNCADGDSLNMKQALKEKYGYFESNIKIFRDADANFSAIQLAVASIVSAVEPDSEIVFFFSGHSATSKADIFQNGDSMNVGLALYSASGGSEIIWDGQLEQWFSGAQTSRVVFVFDTCHAGGLSSYLQKDGREVVMSSAENQYSYTYSLGGPSGPGEGMFTHYFAKIGMIGGQADGFNALKSNKYDGNVAVEEAFQFFKTYILAATRNRQVPALNDKFANDLLL